MTRNTDKTPSEILIVHGEGSAVAAKRIKRNLASLQHPISIRNERWGYDPKWYMIVLVLGEDARKTGNTIKYDLDEWRGEVESSPKIRYRNLSRRGREKALGDQLTERIMEDLQGAL